MPLIASCHCGATKLSLPHAPTDGTECTCTYCARTGAVWAYYKPAEVTVLSRAEGGTYVPTNPRHQHFFCAVCGCTTHGLAPDYTEAHIGSTEVPEDDKISVNLRLLIDFDLSSIPVHKVDGRNLW